MYQQSGWLFHVREDPCPAKDETLEELELGFKLNPGEHLPEVVWLGSSCVIENEEIRLTFDVPNFMKGTLRKHQSCDSAQDAFHTYCLCPLGADDENLKLPFAKSWNAEVKNPVVISPTKNWTHLSGFKGAVTAKEEQAVLITHEELEAENVMPVDLIKDTSIPIKFFQHIRFAEDDLADCGNMEADLKLRVMPSFFYLAMTQLIRIDGSVQRTRTVRVFHEFGTRVLLRETTTEDWEHLILDVSTQDESTGHKLGVNTTNVRKVERLQWEVAAPNE